MAVTAAGSGTELSALGVFTVTIATPAVVSYTAHGLGAGDTFIPTTTGALPTGMTAGTKYFVISAGLTANAFEFAATDGGAAINTSGSQSGTHSLTSESIVLDVATAGTYTFHVDASVLAALDVLELRVYQMVLTGGTRRVAYYQRYDGAQPADDMIKISVPISNELTDAGALRFTLRQPAGTPRSVVWKVLRYA